MMANRRPTLNDSAKMRPLKVFVKIVLMVVGALMMLGGGFCAMTNVVFMLPNLSSGDISLFGVLFGISIAVLAAGALLLKWGMGRKSSDAGEINK